VIAAREFGKQSSAVTEQLMEEVCNHLVRAWKRVRQNKGGPGSTLRPTPTGLGLLRRRQFRRTAHALPARLGRQRSRRTPRSLVGGVDSGPSPTSRRKRLGRARRPFRRRGFEGVRRKPISKPKPAPSRSTRGDKSVLYRSISSLRQFRSRAECSQAIGREQNREDAHDPSC
jgi:hypothetical protein